MHKKIGAILLVAGTCIGSGMIALPLVLAKLGLVFSIVLMISIWFIMYYTSLINLELNLQAENGLSLGALGKHFSGRKMELVGVISLKLLSYALLAVFIYGGSSVSKELLATKFSLDYSLNFIASAYTLLVIALLMLPIHVIDYFNRFLFMGLLLVVAILIVGLAISINWSNLPYFSDEYTNISVWAALIPVVFTSFGFQVIFHTMTNYCHKDKGMLKKAFFWGSLIPAVVYILWTSSILSVVYHDNPPFYQKMMWGNAEVGELIQVLGSIAKWHSVQLLVWSISLLAIATSVLGVGVGLCDSLKKMMSNRSISKNATNFLAAIVTVLPAYIVVILVPNAFIAVLGFAGMILAVIAILLPVYLFTQIKSNKLFYPELKHKWLICLSVIVGLLVLISELYNMS